MNLKKILGATLLIATFTLVSFKGDKDPLHKRKVDAQVTEIKDGKPKGNKPGVDLIEFKNGKVYSSFCWDKMEFSDVKYAINKDSTFTDEGEEKHYMEVEAITTNDKNETLNMTFIVNGYDIEGSYKLVKKDVVKKMFTFTGKEKVKAKKEKKE